MRTVIALLGMLTMGYTHVARTTDKPVARDDGPPSLTTDRACQDTNRNKMDRKDKDHLRRYPHADSLNHNLGNARDTVGSPRDTSYRK